MLENLQRCTEVPVNAGPVSQLLPEIEPEFGVCFDGPTLRQTRIMEGFPFASGASSCLKPTLYSACAA